MPVSIDDLIAKLSMLEDKAEKANVSLNKIAVNNAIKGLQQTRANLSGLEKSDYNLRVGTPEFNKTMKTIADKVFIPLKELDKQLGQQLKGATPLKSRDIANLGQSLSEISNVVNSIVAAGRLAERINKTIFARIPGDTTPKETSIMLNPNKIYGTGNRQNYYPNTLGNTLMGMGGGVGLTPESAKVQSIVKDLIHEVSHAADEQLRNSGARTFNYGQTYLRNEDKSSYKPDFYEQHIAPLLELAPKIQVSEYNKWRKLGYDESFSSNQADYWGRPSEIYARNMASYATTGKSENPELQTYIEREFKELPQAFRDLITEVKKQESRLREDIATTFPKETSTGIRPIQTNPELYSLATSGGAREELDRRLQEKYRSLGLIKEQINKDIEETIQLIDDTTKVVTPAKRTRGKVADFGGDRTKYQNLQRTLSDIVRGGATGGTPTEEGISKVVDQILGGKELGRVRVGGGARVSITKIKDQIDKAISDAMLASAQEKATELKTQVAGGAGGGKPPILPGILSGSEEIPKPKPGETSTPLGKALQNASPGLQQIVAQLKSLGNVGEDAIGKIVDAFIKLDGQVYKISAPNLGKAKDGFRKLTTTVYTGTDPKALSKQNFTGYLSEDLQDFLPDLPKKVLPNVKSQLDEISKQFGKPFADRIRKEIGSSQQAFKDIGVHRIFDKIDVSTPVRLSDGIEKVNVTVSKGMQGLEKYTLYLNRLGDVMNQVEKEAFKLAENQFTQPQLVDALGEVPTKKALALAQKHKFSIENLQSVTTQEPTGVSTLKFQAEDEAGVIQKLEVTTDKFGNVLTRTNKRLLSFTDAIIKNTQEVLRWSIGVGLVYGSMYKLQEVLRIAIDNEAKLADISVVLGDAQQDLNKIFENAAKVAKETGESVNAVLETYTLAFRAVGGVSDPVKKNESAMKLLTDATILNKLSSLEASDSIDVLAGSLRQLQRPEEDTAQAFDRGRKLLDDWVTVSRKANVDLSTLATAFSITAESAENSGVSIEELNAIIASLAEKIGGLGGRETGNAVRALIGGVYQQQAAETLNRFGISVQDTTGRMRPFLSISKEIYSLYSQKIISADELNKIGYVLGGGVRRGQQYVAFLSDFERIQQLVTDQTNSSGAAQEALSKKLDTTQTALTKLNNSFQELAQTLGTDGGVLDLAQGLVATFSTLVGLLNTTSKILGGITIPATILGVMSIMYRGDSGALKKADTQASIGSFFGNMVRGGGNLLGLGNVNIPRGGGAFVGPPMSQQMGLAASGFGSKYGLGILASSYQAIQRGLQQDLLPKERVIAAGADLGGAIIGTILAGGNPIGGVVGSAIADTFVGQTLSHKADFENLFVDVFTTASAKVEEEKNDLEKRKKDVTQEIFKGAGGGSIFEGMLKGRASAFAFNMTQYFRSGEFGNMTPEQGALAQQGLNKTIDPQLLKEIQDLRRQTPVDISDQLLKDSQIEAERIQLTKDQAKVLQEITNTTKEQLRIDSARGDIKPSQYLEKTGTAVGFEERVPKLYTAVGEQFDQATEAIDGTRETFQAFSDILINASSEDSFFITQLTDEIFALNAGLEEIKKGKQDTFIFGDDTLDEAEATKKLADNTDRLTEGLILLRKEQALNKVKIPSVVSIGDVTDKGAFDKVMDLAGKLQADKFSAAIREGFLTPEVAQSMKDDAEPIFVYLGQQLGYHLAKGITDSSFITDAAKILEEEISKVNLGFQEYDVTNPVLNQVVQQSGAIAEQWKMLYGYKPDYQEELAITNDGIIQPMKADWKIVQYLLQQILDTEKKQLDGIYNLPEGAGFYVPYQTLGLAYQKGLNEAGVNVEPGTAQAPTPKGPYVEQTPEKGISDMRRDYERAIKRTVEATTKVYLPRALEVADKYYGPEETRFVGRKVPPQELKPEDIFKNPFGEQSSSQKLFDLIYSKLENLSTNPPDIRGMFDNIISNLTTSLNLSINSTTSLIVDGRVLAEVIKPYLQQDLIRYENTAGAINRVVSI